jgi:hypothetical protein
MHARPRGLQSTPVREKPPPGAACMPGSFPPLPSPQQQAQQRDILDEYASMSAEISELLAEVDGPTTPANCQTTPEGKVAGAATPDGALGSTPYHTPLGAAHGTPPEEWRQPLQPEVRPQSTADATTPLAPAPGRPDQQQHRRQHRQEHAEEEQTDEDEGEEGHDEPTAQEIADYARGTLGIDPVWDAELLWIAAEGLRAPLPAGWAEVRLNL